MKNGEIFREIARRCSPEVALSLGGIRLCKRVGGAAVARVKRAENYISPFRSDDSVPSFSFIVSRDGRWLWKDFGNGEHGDLIDIVARGANLSKGDAAREIDRKLTLGLWVSPKPKRTGGGASAGFSNIQTRPLTSEIAEQIAHSIGLVGTEAIWYLSKLGMLHVGDCWIATGFRQKDCWMLIDTVTKSATARRIDGGTIGRLKSATPKGWGKRPIGLSLIRGSVGKHAVIAEGEKDLVSVVHALPNAEETIPICMPSVTTKLTEDSLPSGFSSVQIFGQADQPGVDAAIRWAEWCQQSERLTVYLPAKKGEDQADLMMGRTHVEAARALFSDLSMSIDRAQLIDLNPEDFPKGKDHKRPPKQRGSPKNVERDEIVRQVIKTLSPSERKSDTVICRALGWPPDSNHRSQVRRSRVRIGLK